MSRTLPPVDVVVAGFGPVGQVAANRLGQLGVRTLCLERSSEPHGTPRAAVLDDGCLRVLQRAGLSSALAPVLLVSGPVATVDARGRERQVLDPAVRRDGHPQLVSFDQRELEDVLAAGVARFDCVHVRLGCAVSAVEQDATGVTVVASDAGGPLSVRASWLLACDGASSTVRRLRGIHFAGSTFAQPWLVVDAEVEAPVARVPGVRFVTDPRRPAVTLPLTPRLHRWELMLGPDGAAPDWREAVAPWVDPSRLRLRRAAVYTYHARMAARWRDGRVLLIGDAAHVMPPFAGQGLSAGVRDADNAAWKLAAVVRGEAPEALLDTVESERRPDVARYTALARLMGAVVQSRRARVAWVRDAVEGALRSVPRADAFFSRGGGRPVSRLGAGARLRTPGAGRLVPQPRVRTADGRELLLDDALPAGWAVLARDGVDVTALGLPAVVLGRDVVDLEGTLEAWLRRRRAAFVVVRPDRYVYATGGLRAVARVAHALAQLRLRGAEAPVAPVATGACG